MNEEQKTNLQDKYKDLVTKIESLSILELSELVKTLEEKFGVSASAMTSPASSAQGEGEEQASKDSYKVVLKSAGDQKVNVIKTIKEITGLGLKESKDIVDAAPKAIKEGVKKTDADEMKKKLETVGAVVELE